MKNKILKIVQDAKKASHTVAVMPTPVKNRLLKKIAAQLVKRQAEILAANGRDLATGRKLKLSAAMLDRLMLDEKRIQLMSRGVIEVSRLADPVGQVVEERERNGLHIKRVRIPLGVIGMIYESRPNVTVDAAALCLKSGNAVVLRGGSEAFQTSQVLVKIMQDVLRSAKVDPAIITMIPQTDRQAMITLLGLKNDIDVLIPRGGENLMRFVGEYSKIPVIKHDRGVCGIFVDESANIAKSIAVIINAKTQRPGVCNALESLYVHHKIAKNFLPPLCRELATLGVELRGDSTSKKIVPQIKKAIEKDFGREFLELILSIKVVADVDDAIANIRKYGSRHTESILTQIPAHAHKFTNSLDASCVMVNTSTRFNDGFELGLGAEIGISTTKLHAYGPMGLAELTTTHYVINSDYRARR